VDWVGAKRNPAATGALSPNQEQPAQPGSLKIGTSAAWLSAFPSRFWSDRRCSARKKTRVSRDIA
jgi:hypothetical protein